MFLLDFEKWLTKFNNEVCYIRVARVVGEQPSFENVD